MKDIEERIKALEDANWDKDWNEKLYKDYFNRFSAKVDEYLEGVKRVEKIGEMWYNLSKRIEKLEHKK